MGKTVNAVLQRATGTSVQEIDKLITELQTLRDTPQSEAARVQREIVEYATLGPRGLAVDQDHRRKPDEVENGRRCATTRSRAPHLADLVRRSYRSGAVRSILKALLLLSRSPGPLHECLDFFQSEAAIFVGVHGLEDALMRCLELLQRDSPVAVTVHQSEEHPHHHAGM
jgi:hypothetical protein